MSELFLIILAIIAVVLTVWLVIIPAGVVAGSVRAFRDRAWKRQKPRKP